MQEQIDKLSRKLKLELNKRIILDDRKNKVELSKDELTVIEQFIYIASHPAQYEIPTIVRISTRYHLDFISWVNGIDVLLCDNSKRWIK
ncbi:hypothetical protein [Pedobacter sp. MR2016-24]|uniref:hypothetical protein n=1 Tax=Pedobacter sp. MR2016-24 TaxID=2994466 RepID=UPI00224619F2|nr:hypothetical protein [Pedobacter sp. MR2016-24]MCX2486617.1 hypothetical protein [Pedobacter sp. MR2016-24]